LSHARWLLFEQCAGTSIPMPFLVVVVFWLCIIFASFGLYAPRNATVIATLCVCALSVSGAIFLILELDRPFEGIVGSPTRRCNTPSPSSASRPSASDNTKLLHSAQRRRSRLFEQAMIKGVSVACF
jgi:hypothetical protein